MKYLKNTLAFLAFFLGALVFFSACEQEYIFVEHTKEYIFPDITMEKELLTDGNGNQFWRISIYQMEPVKTLIGEPFDVPFGKTIHLHQEELENGYRLVFYYEDNATEGYHAGSDELENVLILRHGNDGRDAIVKYGPTDDGTAFWFVAYTKGDPEPEPMIITLPQGEQGYSLVMTDEPVVENSVEVGFKLLFYQDRDRDNEVSYGDVLVYGREVMHGTSERFDFWFSSEDDCTGVTANYEITRNGVVVKSGSTCIPKGENGETPSVMTVRYDELPGAVEGSGMIIYWYIDKDLNGKYDGEDKLLSHNFLKDGEKGDSGNDGENGMSVSLKIYDYNGDSSKVHLFYYDLNLSKDFEMEQDSIIETYVVQLIYPGQDNPDYRSSNYAILYDYNVGNTHTAEKEGAEFKNMSASTYRLHGLYNSADQGYYITPEMPPYDDAYRIDFQYAVSCHCTIEIYFMKDGEWKDHPEAAIHVDPFDYDKFDLDTYRHFAMWWSDQGHIERFKIVATKTGGKKCASNEEVNIDNLRILMDDDIGSGYEQP